MIKSHRCVAIIPEMEKTPRFEFVQRISSSGIEDNEQSLNR